MRNSGAALAGQWRPDHGPDGAEGRGELLSHLRRLIRQSSHYFGGRIGLLLLGFISFPLFTRLYSLTDYGLINLVLKVVLMLTALSKLGLQHSISRFYKQYAMAWDPHALPTYFSSILFGSVAISAGFASAFAVVVAVAPWRGMPENLRPALLLASILLFTGTVRSIVINFLRAEERTKLYNLLEVTIKALSLALVCAFCFVSGATVKSFIQGVTLSEVVGLSLIVTPLVRARMIDWRKCRSEVFRAAIVFGVPLIGLELGNLALDSGDRLLVAGFLGAEQLGLYSAAANIAAYIQDLLMAPVTLAVFPIYMNLWTSQGPEATRQFLSTSLQGFVCVAFGVLAVVAPTAKPAVLLLASSKFAGAAALVPVLTLGLVLFAIVPFFTAGLYLRNQTGTIAITTILSAVVNLGLNAVLLPRMGLMGSAVACAIGYGALLAVTARLSAAHLRLDINFALALRCVLAAGVAAAPSYLISTGMTAVDLLARTAVTGGIYAGLVYLVEPRLRVVAEELFQKLRGSGARRAGAA